MYKRQVSIRGYKPKVKGHIVQIKKVVEAIQKAKKPLICAGGGVVLGHAEPVIQEFCEKYSIPVVTTMMGVGSMPKRHPLFFGMLGTNGKPYANRAVAESDLLIIVGARVNDRSIGASVSYTHLAAAKKKQRQRRRPLKQQQKRRWMKRKQQKGQRAE